MDTLASNLDDKDFKYLMLELSHDKLEKRKDAHPYDWVYSYEKFNYPSSPDKKHVYSSLRDAKSDKSDEHISEE